MLSDDEMMSPEDCMSATALQISFLCSAMSHDVTKPLSYDVTLDDEYQQQVLEILDCAIRQQDQHVLHAALILVQVRGLNFPPFSSERFCQPLSYIIPRSCRFSSDCMRCCQHISFASFHIASVPKSTQSKVK